MVMFSMFYLFYEFEVSGAESLFITAAEGAALEKEWVKEEEVVLADMAGEVFANLRYL
jgi:hypothetical protein